MESLKKIAILIAVLIVGLMVFGLPQMGASAQTPSPICPSYIDMTTPVSLDYAQRCGFCIPQGTPTPGGIGITPITVPTIEEMCTVTPSGNSCTYATHIPDWAETQFPGFEVPDTCVWGPYTDEDGVTYPDLNLYQCGYLNPTAVVGWTCPYVPDQNTPTPRPTSTPTVYEVFLGTSTVNDTNSSCHFGIEGNWVSVPNTNGLSPLIGVRVAGNGLVGNDGYRSNLSTQNQVRYQIEGTMFEPQRTYITNFRNTNYPSYTLWYRDVLPNNLTALTDWACAIHTLSYDFYGIYYGIAPVNEPTLTPTPDCNVMGTAVAATAIAESSCGIPEYRDDKPIIGWDGWSIEPGTCQTILPAFNFSIPAVSGIWEASTVGWGGVELCPILVTIPKMEINILDQTITLPIDVFVIPVVAWLIGLIIKL